MPKKNIDEIVAIAEPIEVTIDGKDFRVPDMNFDRLGRAVQCGQRMDRDSDNYDPDAGLEDVLPEQLSILTGEPEEVFRTMDVRKVTAAISFIMAQLSEQQNRAQRRQQRRR